MDSYKHILGAEGCSSSESGWTMYLASPMQDEDECSYDDNNYNVYNVSNNYHYAAADDEVSDDSMVSEAASGPHHQKTHENGHGTVHSKHNKDSHFNIKYSSATKPEKMDRKSDKNSAKKSRKLDARRKHK